MPEYEKKTDKERIAEITDKLENGIKDLVNGDNFKKYLATMSKFHNYSFNNTMLIAMQKPDASLVAGFNTWKNKFERNVNRGEKGIQIFAPSPYTIKKEQTKLDKDTQLPVLDKNGKPITEEVEVKIPSFKVVSVFDVSQTSGKELPTLGTDELTGNVEDFDKFFAALKEVSPVPIGFEQIENGAKGYFSRDEHRIAINEGMSEVQTIKTAVHEIAHSKLHDRDLKKSDVEQKPKDRNTEEVEAESIAYTVCTHFGIDTSDYSFAYVATWGSDKEVPELKSSLETIRATSNELINGIDDVMKERTKEQEKTAEQPDKSNIIGNTAYSAIEDKQYFRLKSETAEKVAQYLTDNNIPFSGRINGDKTTLTIGQKNVEDYKEAVAAATGKETVEQKENKAEIIGNCSFKDIQSKSFVKLPTDTALSVAKLLEEQGIKFSGKVDGEKTTLTMSKNDVDSYKAALAVVNQPKDIVAERLPEQPKVAVEPHPHFDDKFILKEIATNGTLTTGTKSYLIDFCKEKLAASVSIPQLTEMIDKAEQTRTKDNHYDTPLYLKEYSTARENREESVFRNSYKANIACAKAIDNAISQNYENNTLNSKAALDSVSQQFGFDRVSHVVAARVSRADWDGRYRNEVKAWAKEECAELPETVMKRTLEYSLNSHSGLIDLFAVTVINRQQELEKQTQTVKSVSKAEIPIYQESAAYAKKFGESDQWRSSFALNMECKNAIEADASMAYHEKRSKPFLQKLVSEYGVDRPLYVLARTVKMKGEYDGRFSPEVKTIADKYDYPDMKLKYDNTQQYVTDVHSVFVDEMVYRLTEMKANLEKETQTEIEDKKLDTPMPDETVTVADRNSFGYTWDGMLPLGVEKALELFENNQNVYLLHEDNTESLAVSGSDIEQHRGMLGIETEEWSNFLKIKEHYKELADKEPEYEAQLFNESEKAVGIYQLNDNPDTAKLCFEPLSRLQQDGITPDKEKYTLVYALDVSDDKAKSENELLEDVFEKFNIDRPNDFKGHSLSVSDIVVIQDKGNISSHYCDTAGFQEIAFLQNDRQKLQMKQVEDIVEQNDNSFDGIINNTPSVAELEARAKSGETISLTDMANAIKNERDKPVVKPEKKPSIHERMKQAKERQQPAEKDKETPTKKGMEI